MAGKFLRFGRNNAVSAKLFDDGLAGYIHDWRTSEKFYWFADQGAKTTLMVHIAGEMAKAGYRVMYINADASASDIKDYKFHAMEYGYSLINPDLIQIHSPPMTPVVQL